MTKTRVFRMRINADEKRQLAALCGMLRLPATHRGCVAAIRNAMRPAHAPQIYTAHTPIDPGSIPDFIALPMDDYFARRITACGVLIRETRVKHVLFFGVMHTLLTAVCAEQFYRGTA